MPLGMFGKGVKRKHTEVSEDGEELGRPGQAPKEDEEAERRKRADDVEEGILKALAIGEEITPVMVCGDEVPYHDYAAQRQRVLSLSLGKLQMCRGRSELCLRSYVLITGTLRLIQEELRCEGSQRPVLPPWFGVPATAADCEDSNRQPPSLVSRGASLPTAHLDAGDGLLPSILPETSLLRASLSQESAVGRLKLEPRLLCTENIPNSANGIKDLRAGPSATEDIQAKLAEARNPTDLLLSGFELPDTPVLLQDLCLDDDFTDIDTTMCDFDLFAPAVLASSRSSVSQVASVPSPGVPSTHAPPPIEEWSSRSLPSACGSVTSSGQQFKTDLSELDHIMEVLVGS
uniref:SERTA domain-containing protein 2-like isoform X1 n=2 Tax=Myxine glutinosa TaxID=7769 RepID=UPI00358F28A2